METSWRNRKNSLDITALDAAVKAVIDVDLPNGRIPKIMKRHYKENFVRYDIGIGTVGYKYAESYEKTVAGPVFDTIKERAVKNGWKAFYQPSYGSRGSVAWMDYYVQLRIPYDNTTTIQEGTCVNSIYDQLNKIDDSKSLNERGNVKNQRKLNEKRSFTWLDVQNQIAIERNDINPFYDESAAGDYILELVGKIERDLDLSVVSSVQGGNGDVYIHLGDSHTNSGVPIGPINFTDFSDELIDLVLESDSENDFINNYEENILAYIE